MRTFSPVKSSEPGTLISGSFGFFQSKLTPKLYYDFIRANQMSFHVQIATATEGCIPLLAAVDSDGVSSS